MLGIYYLGCSDEILASGWRIVCSQATFSLRRFFDSAQVSRTTEQGTDRPEDAHEFGKEGRALGRIATLVVDFLHVNRYRVWAL